MTLYPQRNSTVWKREFLPHKVGGTEPLIIRKSGDTYDCVCNGVTNQIFIYDKQFDDIVEGFLSGRRCLLVSSVLDGDDTFEQYYSLTKLEAKNGVIEVCDFSDFSLEKHTDGRARDICTCFGGGGSSEIIG